MKKLEKNIINTDNTKVKSINVIIKHKIIPVLECIIACFLVLVITAFIYFLTGRCFFNIFGHFGREILLYKGIALLFIIIAIHFTSYSLHKNRKIYNFVYIILFSTKILLAIMTLFNFVMFLEYDIGPSIEDLSVIN